MLLRWFLLAGCAFAATIPRHSPEFAIDMPNASQTLLSQYKGKVVMLAFILTTCPHCQRTIGIMSKLQMQYGAQRVQMLSAAMDDGAAARVPNFNRQFKPTFPVGWAPRDSVVEYLQHPPDKGMHMPNVVFIDRGGNIRAQYQGDPPFFGGDDEEKNIRGEIDKLLKENAAAPKKSRKK
jgi:thiol-disulfide isomerase/thioredoxin